MSHPKIVIVGGVAGGASAATRARRVNERAQIVLFERGPDISFANCGLPYYVGGAIQERKSLLLATPEALKEQFNIDVRIRHEVTGIDRNRKRVSVLDRTTGTRFEESYDKLILSPGADPIVPEWDGVGRFNVFTLRDVPDSDRIKGYVDHHTPGRAVVIGAGFIGLEMVEALMESGVACTLIELQPQVLPPLDREMAWHVEQVLIKRGVELHLSTSVENLLDDGERVRGVLLGDGMELPADLVLVSIGVRPNARLALDAGLEIGPGGAIACDRYSRTSDPDIYAVGDAAEVRHMVLNQPVQIPLAGPANRNGRLAGEHAATGRSREAPAVLGTAVVKVFDCVAAVTGLGSRAAERAGLDAASSYALRGHHAAYYPGAAPMILKLVYERGSGRILGAQAVGGAGVDKRIDVIATCMRFSGTIDDLAGVDLAYAPPFGAAKDPVHIAAFIAQNQEDGLCLGVPPDRAAPLEGQIVDLRDAKDYLEGSLPTAVHIPLSELRGRLDELDRDRPTYLLCGVGQRAYTAARVLMQEGFQQVAYLPGGYRMWRPDPDRDRQG
ncbi:MAG: FAD-dependent oxidoreductase [Planctomycetota bacterium]